MIYASDYDGTYDFLDQEQKQEVSFIVTGNNYDQYARLYNDGVHVPVFWNPGKEDVMSIVSHKASILNKTGASVFYENQSIQANLLRVLCPKTKIVLIGEKT